MKNDPFQISVNDQYEFSIHPDLVKELDIIPNGEQQFHLLENDQAYHIELVEIDYHNRLYTIRVDGTKYQVKISDYYERLVKKLGLSVGNSHKINSIKAPMPGLVIKVLVEAGQEVKKGDSLLILEAMKMENVLKAAGDGKVKAIKTKKGDPVEKGQILLEFE